MATIKEIEVDVLTFRALALRQSESALESLCDGQFTFSYQLCWQTKHSLQISLVWFMFICSYKTLILNGLFKCYTHKSLKAASHSSNSTKVLLHDYTSISSQLPLRNIKPTSKSSGARHKALEPKLRYVSKAFFVNNRI